MTTIDARSDASPTKDHSLLDEAIERRGRFDEAVTAFLAVAEQSSLDWGADWAVRLRFALHRVHRQLGEHIRSTESVRGIHAEIIREEPRLMSKVNALVDDHRRLQQQVPDVEQLLSVAATEPGPKVLERLDDLASLLRRHRQRGADLVYEAYQVDLGDGH